MPQTEQPRSWMDRNWKWAVPLGCVGTIVLVAAFAGGIVIFVFHVMKSSVVYQNALARAQAHPAVVDALGTPIKPGFWVTGEINTSLGSGSANLVIPLNGPVGAAGLYVTATKSGDYWKFTSLEVHVKNAETRINLLTAESAAPQ